MKGGRNDGSTAAYVAIVVERSFIAAMIASEGLRCGMGLCSGNHATVSVIRTELVGVAHTV